MIEIWGWRNWQLFASLVGRRYWRPRLVRVEVPLDDPFDEVSDPDPLGIVLLDIPLVWYLLRWSRTVVRT